MLVHKEWAAAINTIFFLLLKVGLVLHSIFRALLSLIMAVIVIKWLKVEVPGVAKIPFLLCGGPTSPIFFPFFYNKPTVFSTISTNYYILFVKKTKKNLQKIKISLQSFENSLKIGTRSPKEIKHIILIK